MQSSSIIYPSPFTGRSPLVASNSDVAGATSWDSWRRMRSSAARVVAASRASAASPSATNTHGATSGRSASAGGNSVSAGGNSVSAGGAAAGAQRMGVVKGTAAQ